jgi:hypothetical protein
VISATKRGGAASWEGRQCGSGGNQVGAYLDGLAEFGFGVRLVFESQVSKTGEVMSVGSADAR